MTVFDFTMTVFNHSAPTTPSLCQTILPLSHLHHHSAQLHHHNIQPYHHPVQPLCPNHIVIKSHRHHHSVQLLNHSATTTLSLCPTTQPLCHNHTITLSNYSTTLPQPHYHSVQPLNRSAPTTSSLCPHTRYESNGAFAPGWPSSNVVAVAAGAHFERDLVLFNDVVGVTAAASDALVLEWSGHWGNESTAPVVVGGTINATVAPGFHANGDLYQSPNARAHTHTLTHARIHTRTHTHTHTPLRLALALILVQSQSVLLRLRHQTGPSTPTCGWFTSCTGRVSSHTSRTVSTSL
jgi:hypothetical protein